ncbi:MAG: VWA domain-containing protein, partial [Candidatus Kariarchaeaceae archaeon]
IADQDQYLNQDPETWNPLDHVNSTVSETILKSAKLDLLWRELYPAFPGHVWLYMGFEYGFHRSFPWHSYSKSYDPRIRPWYVGAVTGAKDVVVILDTSGSMAGSPLTNTKEAVKNVFKTLGPRDRLTVISFSGNVQSFHEDLEIYSNILQTDTNNYVDSLVAAGSTNINEAILDGLGILKNKGSEDRTPVIIFMTDGEPTAGITSKNQILSNIQNENDLDAKVFVFGLGSGIDTEFLSDIAEQNSGASVFIENDDDIPDAMNRYYQFFTSEPSKSLIWSYPYIDQSGFGFIITASKPVIVDGKFYGVISADLTLIHLIEEMKEFQPSSNGYNFIFDSAGVMVVHPDIFDQEPADWTTQDIRIPIEEFETFDNEFVTLKNQAVLGESATDSISYGSEKKVVAFAPFGNTSLRFASIIPHGDIARSNTPNLLQIELWQVSWLLFTGIGTGIGVLVVLRSKKLFEGDK